MHFSDRHKSVIKFYFTKQHTSELLSSYKVEATIFSDHKVRRHTIPRLESSSMIDFDRRLAKSVM